MAKTFCFLLILHFIFYSKAVLGVTDNQEINSEPSQNSGQYHTRSHFWPEMMEFLKGIRALSNLQNNMEKFEASLLACSSSYTNSQAHRNNNISKEYSGRVDKILKDAQEINNKNFLVIMETLNSMNGTLAAIITEGLTKPQTEAQSCSNLSTNLQQIETPAVSDEEISKQDQQWIENMLKDPEAKLFTRKNYKGEFEEYSLETTPENGGCFNLIKFPIQINSIDTLGKCVRVFANRSCTGWSQAVYPGSGNSQNVLGSKLTRIESIGPCVKNEFNSAYFQGSKGIRQNITKNLTDAKTYFPDLCEFSSYDKFNNSTQPRDAGSINRIFLGPKSRVEYTRAYIYLRHLNATVSEGNEEENDFFKSLDKQAGDTLGFAIPLNMGGVVKNFNIFPQSQTNKEECTELISSVASYLRNLGNNQGSGRSKIIDSNYATVTLNFVYSCDECTRPDAFYYLISFTGNKFYGRVLN